MKAAIKAVKTYSVSQLSKLAEVSVRTLHHYDQIGLLVPNRRIDNGYRQYTNQHLVMLKQILIYRALDFPIQEIKTLLGSQDSDLIAALCNQKQQLVDKQQDLQNMINSIEDTMNNLQSSNLQTNNFDHLYDGIPKEKAEQFEQAVRAKMGDEKFEQRMAKTGTKFSPQQAKNMNEKSDGISKDMAALLDQPVTSDTVQAVVQRHYDMLVDMYKAASEDFAGLSRDAYTQMALKFVTIEQMKQARDAYAVGTAEHLSEAMVYFAEVNLD